MLSISIILEMILDKIIIMKLKFLLILCALLLSFSVKAQYDISLEIKDSESDTMYIGYFHLGSTYSFDTCVNKKGKFRFKRKDKNMPNGMYFFADTKGKFTEFIIQDETKMSFSTINDDWTANMFVKGSKMESIYYDYLKKSKTLENEFKKLSSITNNRNEYNEKLAILRHQNDSLKEDFIKQYPDHLFSKVLLCSKPIIPPTNNIYNEDGSLDSLATRLQAFQYYKRHYFDNIDLSCDALIRTPKEVFADKYKDFWEKVLKYDIADSLIYYSDSLIALTKEGGDMYKYFINDITKRYLTDNVMGHDKVYVHMIKKYFATGKVTWMHLSDVEMNVQRAERWENLLVGKTVPDLACPLDDDNSQWHSLSELNNRYRLLVFWSIECGHCTKEMPKLAEFYNNNKEKYDLGIFGVHTEGDLNQMREFCQKYNILWTTTNGLYANYNWREYFDIEKTPVIFLLDNNNKILAKNFSVEALPQILDMIEKGLLNL